MTGTSETQATQQQAPVVLPAKIPNACVDTETFCADKKPGCSTSFYDIIYVTGQRRFWLLPKRVADQLKESVSALKQKTVNVEKATRMSNIADTGLLDYFLTPGPEAFLESTEEETGERGRYTAAKNGIADDTAKKAQCRKDWNAAKAAGDSTAAMNAEREMFAAQKRIETHQKTMANLENVSEKRAESLGYKRENGLFYTPRALQARDAMDVYLAEREKAKAHGFRMFDPGTKTVASAWEHLKHYKALQKNLMRTGVVDEKALRSLQINILTLEDVMAKYINAIVELAECGIAVPEFALSPDDQYEGTEEFLAYIKLQGKRASLEQAIEARYSEWVSATAGKAAPPGVLFTKQQDQWHELNKEAEQIKTTAEARVRDALPPRLFVWEPESYKPKPIERLAKANIPLRELSSASSDDLLNHISLKYLARETGGTLGKALNELKVLPKSLAKEADDDRVFSDWLKQEGAHPVDEKGPWFDATGLFVPDTFFEALKTANFKVESLEAADKRKRWGDTLKAMIFEDKQLRNLMLFDNSPQAQLVRCLLPAGSSLQAAVKLEGPQWIGGPQAFSAKANLDVAGWRGEVTLMNLELPERSKAQSLKADYTAYDGSTRTIDFGKLSLDLSVKAWGFAGASLMLARDLTLDQKTGYTSISGVDIAEQTGELARFDLFVGAQAGCKLSGQLFWCPPPGVLPPAPVPNRAIGNQWLSLAKLEVEMAAAVGGSFSGNLMLRVEKGRFLLSIKGSLVWGAGVKGYMTFEVGYESVIALCELVRKEMAANRYEDLDWVEGETLAYLRDLSFLGAIGIDVSFIYLRGYAVVKDIYSILTEGGRGGLIAYTLVRDPNQTVMADWVRNLQPQAFGPLLMELSSTPRPFSVKEENVDISFSEDEAHALQQRAIELCLRWISNKADANTQFEESIICMNRDGSRPPDAGLTYCKNKLKLDTFMAERVKALEDVNNISRAGYRKHVAKLGARLNGYCEHNTFYSGPAFAPNLETTTIYKGPNLD
jgi:translation initiation factor 2 beta subunit (eIF-2beta)/eIF-5